MRYVHVEDPQKSFLLAEGMGTFEVLTAEEKASKAGNDMLKLTLKVWDKDNTSAQIFDYLVGTERMAWKIKHFCDAIGKPEWYGATALLDSALLKGLSGKCEVSTQGERVVGDKKYEARSVVTDYISEEDNVKGNVQDDDLDDPLPF